MGDIATHGWTAVPVDLSKHLNDKEVLKTNPPQPIRKEELLAPTTDLIKSITQYAQDNLPKETFHHSMRVYALSLALLNYLGSEFTSISQETILLACLLHDIGTTPKNMNSTHLSFEFHGGIIAHEVLGAQKACPAPQREAVVEAIIRHQDLGSSGNIHALGSLMQIATITDNLGDYAEFVHPDTVAEINKEFPRLGWSSTKGCAFASSIRKEGKLKPWCHTSKMGVDTFASGIEGNKRMAEFE